LQSQLCIKKNFIVVLGLLSYVGRLTWHIFYKW